MIGERFGRLLVVARSSAVTRKNSKWICRCDCGRGVAVARPNLRSGNTTSCGCFLLQRIKECKTTHGHAANGTTTRTYRIWRGMLARCASKKNSRYGGRGVAVCERWKTYAHFLADMGECPAGRSIDRKDNDGDYEPGNCKWSTAKEQANNRATSRFIEANGQRRTLAEWALLTGVSPAVISTRIRRLGWDESRAVREPRHA